ncbi:MAG: NAD-dependent epimerase/dehydratase family protein [Planctomycetota bacterium]|jgi:nucleoside-diphosphate-sugar epimerase|nr:NAD-dependent epimerase/dehydratase family protein [Planctomycetota bacterium]
MRVLVTGGGGFLGSYIVDALLRRGDAVRVAGRRSHPRIDALGVETAVGDLSDPKAASAAAKGCEAVIHAAGAPGISIAEDIYRRANVIATLNMLAAARERGVRRFVYTGTASVVYAGRSIEGGDESLPYPEHYLSVYARTKAEAERAVIAANSGHLATCVIRPHLIFGPRDTQLIPKLLARARTGRMRRIGDGTNRVSVSYVGNVADAHCLALDALSPGGPAAGQVYFVNEPEPVNCWEFINRIVAGAGFPQVAKKLPLWLANLAGWMLENAYPLLGRKSDPPFTRFLVSQLATSHWFRVDKARAELGWEPEVSLDQGVRLLLDSLNQGQIT